MPATPAVGCICADATCIKVVLPAPLGPRITHRSSSSTVQVMSLRSVACPRRTVTPANSSTAVMHAPYRPGRRLRRHGSTSPRRLRPDGLVAHGLVAWHCRSEEHTSELQSLMRISYAVFCL